MNSFFLQDHNVSALCYKSRLLQPCYLAHMTFARKWGYFTWWAKLASAHTSLTHALKAHVKLQGAPGGPRVEECN
jgi:hypothetical protein